MTYKEIVGYLFIFIVTVTYQRKGSALLLYRAKRKSLLAYTVINISLRSM